MLTRYSNIDLDHLNHQSLLIPSEREGKGWSYSFVYHLRDIKDVYVIVCEMGGLPNIKTLANQCKSSNVDPESGKNWSYRNILEIVNALVNFGLLTPDKKLSSIRFNSMYGEPLSKEDKQIFKNIYFSYFRFAQYLPVLEKSNDDLLYPFCFAYTENSRFFNRIAKPNQHIIFDIDNELAMRYWDVFTKWGTYLNVINKCRLDSFNMNFGEFMEHNTYLMQRTEPMPPNFSVLDFMKDNFSDNCIYIPHLMYRVMENFGFSIEDIKMKIIDECCDKPSEYRLQTVTEIFIKQHEKTLLPFVHDNYKSHILIL